MLPHFLRSSSRNYNRRRNIAHCARISTLRLECLESRTLLTAGMLDPSFGMGGEVVSSVPGILSPSITASALQPDGKVLAVALATPFHTNSQQLALTRTNSDGSVDTTFGSNGRVVTQFSFDVLGTPGVVLQPDHKIVVVASAPVNGTDVFAVARFNADGSIDTSFGMGGIATNTPAHGMSDDAKGGALQSDGKILVVGNEDSTQGGAMAVVRFNVDGSVDTTFGTGGEATAFSVTINTGAGESPFEDAAAVAVQTDGRIVIVGSTGEVTQPFHGIQGRTSSVALARFDSSGSLDTTFGTNGTETVPIASNLTANALVLQPDNKILVTGTVNQPPSGPDNFFLTRLNTDGTLDTSFNQTGVVLADVNPGNPLTTIDSLALQADGKIVVAGFTSSMLNSPTQNDFTLARFNSDGSFDTTFGQAGMVVTSFGAMASASAARVLIQNDNKIVAVGTFAPSSSSLGTAAALARYNPDGSLDASFGTGGEATITFPGLVPVTVNVLALQPDGKIVVAGTVSTAGNGGAQPADITDILVARYDSAGNLDTTFGQGGFATFALTGLGAIANALALQSDGKIVVVGAATVSLATISAASSSEFVTARLNPDGSLDNTFGNQGLAAMPAALSVSGLGLTGVVIQPDGKIVALGEAQTGSNLSIQETVAIRYNISGSLDSSFGANGVGAAPFTNSIGESGGAVLQPDGNIVVVGASNSTWGLVRFNANGSLDTSFGTVGVTAFTGFGATVALQPDGKLIEVGRTSALSSDFAVARYNSDGSPDVSFGTGGMVTTDFSGHTDVATSVVIEPNGKILVGGSTIQNGAAVFALAGYNANGSLDAGFGTNGELTTDFGAGEAAINGLALQPDGSLVAAGSEPHVLGQTYNALSYVDMARYLLPPSQNELFVDQVYRDLLNRQVDPTGLSVFLNALDEGAVTRTQVAQIIESSQEYRTDLVQGFYQSFLHRAADTGGLQAWVSALNGGATIEQVKAGFLGSQEYFQDHGGSNDSFLQAVYQDVLSRPVDPIGAAAWGAQLDAGTPRTTVAAAILASTEAENDLINAVYVKYLHRAPDPSGMAFWLTQLQQGLRDEDFVAGVVGSPEYFSRVS